MTKKRDLTKKNKNFFQEIGISAKLVFKLLLDRRISGFLKLIPLSAFVYLISPDFLPLVPLDDAVVVGFGVYTFIELCPPAIVEEHRRALEATTDSPAYTAETDFLSEEDIIDGEFHE